MAKKKTARFELRMTPTEKEKLIAKAAEAHLTVSQYLIRLSDEKKIVIYENIPEFVHEIRKIGVNINQIAYIGRVHQDMNEIKILVQKILSEVYNADEHTIGTLEQRISELIERVDGFGNGQGN